MAHAVHKPDSKPFSTRNSSGRHAENGVTAFSNVSINALMGGTTNFERELVEGMNASLAKIKAAAEKD